MLDWFDPSCDWWAKLANARHHLRDVAQMEARYLAAEPWKILMHPAGRDHAIRVRFEVLEPVPTELSARVGDVLHNLSSALDSLVFGLASAHAGEALLRDSRLEAVTTFKVVKSKAKLESWAAQLGRNELLSAQDLDLIWRAQSFALMSEAIEAGWVTEQGDPNRGPTLFDLDQLETLRRLHNIDKHRRLPLVLHGPNVPYWSTTGGESRRETRILDIWAHGTDVAEIYNPPSDSVEGEVHWDLRLHLVEFGRRAMLIDRLDELQGTVDRSLRVICTGKAQAQLKDGAV
jgi:hypothetical protein